MSYIKYLENKNLSKNTIVIYSFYLNKWQSFLKDTQPNKTKIINFLNQWKNKSANTIKLIFAVIMSYLKYLKLTKLYYDCLDIKLPSAAVKFKNVINLTDFNHKKEHWSSKNWYDQRNWLIFVFCFTTGIRISEIHQVNKNKIKNHKLIIQGKGMKTRTIFIPKYTQELLNNWNDDFIAIKKDSQQLSYKQLNKIIKKVSSSLFKNSFLPHDLRRSYATNLLRKGVDIKTISELLGHNNINTTSKYIHLTENEIMKKIKNLF